MSNPTLQKFGYPGSLIKSYQYWHLLLRPSQPTIGSLILIIKEDILQYSEVSSEAILEQKLIISEIESTLKTRFNYSRINYLMLMMIDPIVHFHVIPRYEHGVEFFRKKFPDAFWPGPPNLGHAIELSDAFFQELLVELRKDFTSIVY